MTIAQGALACAAIVRNPVLLSANVAVVELVGPSAAKAAGADPIVTAAAAVATVVIVGNIALRTFPP